MADYLHGIEVRKNNDELRVISLPGKGVIGLVGTAPAAEATLPVGACFVFFQKKPALVAIHPQGSTADKGSLYTSAELIYAQGSPTVVISRAKSDSAADITAAIECFLEAESDIGYKPDILCAPGHTGTIPVAVITQINSTKPVNPSPSL